MTLKQILSMLFMRAPSFSTSLGGGGGGGGRCAPAPPPRADRFAASRRPISGIRSPSCVAGGSHDDDVIDGSPNAAGKRRGKLSTTLSKLSSGGNSGASACSMDCSIRVWESHSQPNGLIASKLLR